MANFSILQGIQPGRIIATLPSTSGGGDGGIGDLFSGLQGLIGGFAHAAGGSGGGSENAAQPAQAAQPPSFVNTQGSYGSRGFGTTPGLQQNAISNAITRDTGNLTDFNSLAQTPAFQTAFDAHAKALQSGVTKSPLVTVVDYSRPANTPRMWVVNPDEKKVLLNTYVAQGSTPGFSNTPNSHQSSLGTFLTSNTYNGSNGYSMRIQGLDKGVNDNAFARQIVVHGGNYVGPDKAGTSWGCFAVPTSVAPTLIGLTKQGTIIHAYAPTPGAVNEFSNSLSSNTGKAVLGSTINQNIQNNNSRSPSNPFQSSGINFNSQTTSPFPIQSTQNPWNASKASDPGFNINQSPNQYTDPGFSIMHQSTLNGSPFQIKNASQTFRSGPQQTPTSIIFHDTAGPTLQSAEQTLQQRGLSYHYLIDRDGSVVKLVDPSQQALHAKGYNQGTIGVSFVGGEGYGSINPAQMQAAASLTNQLKQQYPTISGFSGHQHADARGIKSDPEGFDYKGFAQQSRLPFIDYNRGQRLLQQPGSNSNLPSDMRSVASSSPNTPFANQGPLKDPNTTTQTIAQFEGTENFHNGLSHARWDVNHYRVGHGSDTYTTADGQVHNVTRNTVITQADADRDLQRRAQEFATNSAQQVGPVVWNNLNPQTQAALTSVAYNYGSIPRRILPAVRSGDPTAIANAVRSLRNDNKGANYQRRMKEAGMIDGSAPRMRTTAITPQELPNGPTQYTPGDSMGGHVSPLMKQWYEANPIGGGVGPAPSNVKVAYNTDRMQTYSPPVQSNMPTLYYPDQSNMPTPSPSDLVNGYNQAQDPNQGINWGLLNALMQSRNGSQLV